MFSVNSIALVLIASIAGGSPVSNFVPQVKSNDKLVRVVAGPVSLASILSQSEDSKNSIHRLANACGLNKEKLFRSLKKTLIFVLDHKNKTGRALSAKRSPQVLLTGPLTYSFASKKNEEITIYLREVSFFGIESSLYQFNGKVPHRNSVFMVRVGTSNLPVSKEKNSIRIKRIHNLNLMGAQVSWNIDGTILLK